ncbi:MAG: replicative DNA helicase [Phocaeicola sp.]|uniref:replicative DNA helicase n=1 Tax=Phocaeicola TaxID=909656 RepID=UPI00234E9C07|nr:replicative DNA helicase [Phocaeicola oris]MCE2616478.1 replicative DNA helicase [Phocaeicola oris]
MPEQKRSNKSSKTPKTVQVDEYGHLQPQATDLEEAVLGALMVDHEAFAEVSEILRPESFYEHRHQLIYQAIASLAMEQKPIDILTVKNQLEKTGDLEDAGGPFYITQLSMKVASAAHVEYHSKIIAQKYLARQLITFTSYIQTKAFDETEDVEDLMQDAEGKLFEISQQNLKKDYTQINPVIREAYSMLQKAAARTDGISGLASGFNGLDKITSGWQNSDLIIVAARPAMGKTSFVLSMAKNMAVDQRIPCAMFSLEMSNVQLVNRLIVNVCEITGDKIKNGQLEPYEWQQLDYKINSLYDAPLYVDDTPSLSIFELRTKARRLVREHGIKIIFIDYLQLMNASGMSFGSRQEEVSTISRSLKGLAKELNIPIIALSQLNRAVETRVADANVKGSEAKRPQLSDLRESGAIEQDADIVCFIHRPEYYKIYEDGNGRDLHGMAEIIIAKHRNGAVGDVLLRFRSEYARFQNPEDEMIIPGPEPDGVYKTVGSKMNSPSNGNGNVPPPPDVPSNDPFDALSSDNQPPF